VYIRAYTPTVHYLSPPVVYHEALAELWFDPKSTMNLITGLSTDEMPFINARIQGALIDFEDHVESTTHFSGWRKTRVRGQVGELPIASNHSLSMQWETGKAVVLDHYALHCNVANTSCYEARTVPVIFNVSSNTGYTSGGQNLTVYGHGFGQGNITATVDGVNCTVTQHQERSFSCEVAPRSAVSVDNVAQPGSHGLRRKDVRKSGWPAWSHLDEAGHSEHLSMHFEAPYSNGDKLGNVMSGFFVAPKTARYRFYMSCNDKCILKLAFDSTLPDQKTELLSNHHATGYRAYFGSHHYNLISQWVNLTEGEAYAIEGRHLEYNGADHFTVSVEIE